MNKHLIHKYVCQHNIVLDPFKYYAEKGETIFQITFYKTDTKIFIHKKNEVILTIYSNKNFNIKNVENLLDHYKLKNNFEEKLKFIFREYEKNNLFELKFSDSKNNQLKKLNKPIFIVGCGRSGTTMLLSILSCSDELCCINDETYAFYPGGLKADLMLKHISFDLKKRVLEKTPKHILALNKINKFYNGNVKFINIIRDPRAVLTSNHPNHKNIKYWVKPSRWIYDVETGGKYKKNNLLTIKYENLISNFNQTLIEICKFLEIKFDKKMLNFHKFAKIKKNVAFVDTKIQKLDKSRLNSYKNKIHLNRIKYILKNKQIINLSKKYEYKL